jgi:SAM-dependent methyltransferase
MPFDFSRRADLKQYPERMDEPCDFETLRDCLRGIAGVNALVNAYYPTFHWLGYLYSTLPRQDRPLHIVDVGCGYGDMLRRIHLWAQDRHLPVTLTGIDLNPLAVRVAREATPPGMVTYIAGNAFDFHPPGGIDLIISSLTAHHMEGPIRQRASASPAYASCTARLPRQPMRRAAVRANAPRKADASVAQGLRTCMRAAERAFARPCTSRGIAAGTKSALQRSVCV